MSTIHLIEPTGGHPYDVRRTAGTAFLSQRVNRGGPNDPFDGAFQLRVQGYERVCLQLSQCDVLGAIGRCPSQLIRQVPGPTSEDGIAEEPYRHPPDTHQAVEPDVGRDLAGLDRLVQERQGLGPQECRCEELMLARDLDPFGGDMEDGAGVDDEPGNRVPQIGYRRVTP